MSDATTIEAEPRKRVGKGDARATRRAGRVPGVIYGGDDARPLSVSLEARGLAQQIERPGFLNTVVQLKIDGETHRVLPREVQLHPVTDVPLHVDFLRVSGTTRLSIAIPVSFHNEEECPGLRRGGVLNVVRHDIELVCTADTIPREIAIDLTGLDIGDSVHISDVSLPEGVSPAIADRDFTIATVAAPTVMPVEEEEEAEAEEVLEGEEAEAAEGEAEAAEGEEGAKPAEPAKSEKA